MQNLVQAALQVLQRSVEEFVFLPHAAIAHLESLQKLENMREQA